MFDIDCDDLMPSQYWAMRRSTQLTGIQKLYLALLVNAVNYLRGACPKKHREKYRAEALEWVQSTEAAPFSFEVTCWILHLEPSELRTRLLGSTEGTLVRYAVHRLNRVAPSPNGVGGAAHVR